MSWYTVTKTVKGRRYLYLQMTYRVGGKVKTKNRYLGPVAASPGAFGSGAPSNLPTGKNQPDASPAGGVRIDPIRRQKPKAPYSQRRRAAVETLKIEGYLNAKEIRAVQRRLKKKTRLRRLFAFGDRAKLRDLADARSTFKTINTRAFGKRLKFTKRSIGQAKSIDKYVAAKEATELTTTEPTAEPATKGE